MVIAECDKKTHLLPSDQKVGLLSLPPQQQIQVLKDLAISCYLNIITHQEPTGLIQASLGRYDDPYFYKKVWIKDVVRAVNFTLDPLVRQYIPELQYQSKTPKHLYLSATESIMRLQQLPEQWERFKARPGIPDNDGYATIPCHQTPAIKFDIQKNPQGEIYQDWGHNQPDNWGTLLLGFGKGREQGMPFSEKNDPHDKSLCEIAQEIAAYVSRLHIERFRCRSIWEHEICWSSYSTRRIVLAGLEQIIKVWGQIEDDSKYYNYQLSIQKNEVQEAEGRLREKVTEHFPADFTDCWGHNSTGDLASLVVQNEIDLPSWEQKKIIKNVAILENDDGFHRYRGDPWKRGEREAKWTMGKPLMGGYFFRKSLRLYHNGEPQRGDSALRQGLTRMAAVVRIKEQHNYIPELFITPDQNNYYPNNNQLAWTLGNIIEAAAAGIAAMTESQKYHQQAA